MNSYKKYKDMTPEEKEKLLGDSKLAGIAATTIGAAGLGAGFLQDNKKLQEKGKKMGIILGGEKAKKLKLVSGATAATGLGLYGVAKYKHHKLKEENEDSKK